MQRKIEQKNQPTTNNNFGLNKSNVNGDDRAETATERMEMILLYSLLHTHMTKLAISYYLILMKHSLASSSQLFVPFICSSSSVYLERFSGSSTHYIKYSLTFSSGLCMCVIRFIYYIDKNLNANMNLGGAFSPLDPPLAVSIFFR